MYYIVTSLLLGFMLGGFLGTKLFAKESDMGWDQLANFMGGVMVGVVAAAAVTAFTVRNVAPKKRMILGSAFLAGAAILVVVLRLLAE